MKHLLIGGVFVVYVQTSVLCTSVSRRGINDNNNDSLGRVADLGRLSDFNDMADEETEGSLKLKNSDMWSESPSTFILKNNNHYIPVNHYARHALCAHEHGRKKFYTGLKHKLCYTKETFVSKLVEDLCKHRGSILDSWVSEVFDIDGDGYLTHFERHFYDD